MSQENVEIVRGIVNEEDLVQLFREDSDRWAAARTASVPHFHPDFECVRHDVPGGKTYVGFVGLRGWYLDWLAPWAEYRTAVNEFIDCGDRVITLQHSSGRLHGSTQEVTMDPATLWTIRDGKIARWEVYPSHDDALKAVGLAE
jgi:ketosteroid isomerase-like protein